MNLKLKSLVAAVVLAASIPAHAALDSTSAANSSSLVLTLLDTVDNISASFDLGKNYSDFNIATNTGYAVSTLANPDASLNWSLSSNANYSAAWTSFFSTATAANTIWTITAASSQFGTNGGQGIISTYAGTPATYGSAVMVTSVGNINTFLTDAGNSLTTTSQNHTSVADGADVAASGTNAYTDANALWGIGNGKINGSGPVVTGTLGSALGLIQFTNVTTRNAQAVQTVFGNSAQFLLDAQGNLTYSTVTAAVPEADTSAMMLAGLGLMGFIARRRTKA